MCIRDSINIGSECEVFKWQSEAYKGFKQTNEWYILSLPQPRNFFLKDLKTENSEQS